MKFIIEENWLCKFWIPICVQRSKIGKPCDKCKTELLFTMEICIMFDLPIFWKSKGAEIMLFVGHLGHQIYDFNRCFLWFYKNTVYGDSRRSTDDYQQRTGNTVFYLLFWYIDMLKFHPSIIIIFQIKTIQTHKASVRWHNKWKIRCNVETNSKTNAVCIE